VELLTAELLTLESLTFDAAGCIVFPGSVRDADSLSLTGDCRVGIGAGAGVGVGTENVRGEMFKAGSSGGTGFGSRAVEGMG